jgi:hypothetical protein
VSDIFREVDCYPPRIAVVTYVYYPMTSLCVPKILKVNSHEFFLLQILKDSILWSFKSIVVSQKMQ